MNIQMSKSAVMPSSQMPGEVRGRVEERVASVKALSQALKAEDLSTARQAYAGIVRNAPPGATMEAGSPFAQLGKALASGDLQAAQTAFQATVDARRRQPDMPVKPPEQPLPEPTPQPVYTSSTGGVSGGTVNVTA